MRAPATMATTANCLSLASLKHCPLGNLHTWESGILCPSPAIVVDPGNARTVISLTNELLLLDGAKIPSRSRRWKFHSFDSAHGPTGMYIGLHLQFFPEFLESQPPGPAASGPTGIASGLVSKNLLIPEIEQHVAHATRSMVENIRNCSRRHHDQPVFNPFGLEIWRCRPSDAVVATQCPTRVGLGCSACWLLAVPAFEAEVAAAAASESECGVSMWHSASHAQPQQTVADDSDSAGGGGVLGPFPVNITSPSLVPFASCQTTSHGKYIDLKAGDLWVLS